jgi:hypothetical protein
LSGNKKSNGTKLLRLVRIPRLFKLLDINRMTEILRSFRGKEINGSDIVEIYI